MCFQISKDYLHCPIMQRCIFYAISTLTHVVHFMHDESVEKRLQYVAFSVIIRVHLLLQPDCGVTARGQSGESHVNPAPVNLLSAAGFVRGCLCVFHLSPCHTLPLILWHFTHAP